MYLELADGYGGLPSSALYEGESERGDSPYLFVPAGVIPGVADDIYVNEAMFDTLPPYEWNAVMEILEPYQGEKSMGLWPFSTKAGRQRRSERRDTRQQQKLERIAVRGQSGGGVLGNVLGTIGNIITGGDTTQRPATQEEMDLIAGRATGMPGEKSWVQRNWPWLLGGAAAVTTVAVVATRRRRRSR